MLNLKGKYISTFVENNMVNNHKNFMNVAFDAFLEIESDYKTHVKKNKSKDCKLRVQFKNGFVSVISSVSG
jgi:hypothetical protein